MAMFHTAGDYPFGNIPDPIGLISFPGSKSTSGSGGFQHTKSPTTTASSILGLKFNGGVMIVADTLGSYGSLARFRNCPRIIKINDNIILGGGGDYADFQYVQEIITQKIIDEQCIDDGITLKPKAMYNWLSRLLYNRRSQFDPLWNNFIVGGLENGEPFLGTVDKLGTAYQDSHCATGFGAYLALPILRNAYEQAIPQGGLTEQQSLQVMKKCVEVLYYRDARSWPKYTVGVITKDGVKLEGPFLIESNWDVASMIRGYE